MVTAKFTDEMIKIITSMIGKVFCSYECGNTFDNQTYCNFQINLEDSSIEFMNEVKDFPFYDSSEELSTFSCKKLPLNTLFKPYCGEPSKKHLINEEITSVSIVNDEITINNDEYSISFDMAIIIDTTSHKYTFSRGWFFGEEIDISKDLDFNDVYPIHNVIEDWSEDGENDVKVIRTKKVL